MTITIHTDNTISLNSKYVGRVNLTKQGAKGPEYTIFSTRSGSWTSSQETPTEHKITVPTYIGSGSNWFINPEFEKQITDIVSSF